VAGISDDRGCHSGKHRNLNTCKRMKYMIRNTLALAALAGVLTTAAFAAETHPGYVDFGKFVPSKSGGEFVEVNLKSNLINMVARLTSKEEPEVAEMLKGLHAVRVNVIGLDDSNREATESRVKSIRSELEGKGWERIVTAQEKNQDVGIFLKTRGEEAIEGLVVTVIENNREAVLVNIVGDIKPEKLAELGERLDIEPLKKVGKPLEKKAKK
jgi:hypothetical protein